MDLQTRRFRLSLTSFPMASSDPAEFVYVKQV